MQISRRELLSRCAQGVAALAVIPTLPRVAVAYRPTWSTQSSQLSELERLIRESVTAAAVPGVSIAVLEDATVTWHRELGVRDVASPAPVDEQTLFEVASISNRICVGWEVPNVSGLRIQHQGGRSGFQTFAAAQWIAGRRM